MFWRSPIGKVLSLFFILPSGCSDLDLLTTNIIVDANTSIILNEENEMSC